MFDAILDRDLGSFSMCNGCVRDGVVYLLPAATFELEPAIGEVRSAQAPSPVPVRPLARFAVRPEDFPFLRKIHGRQPTPAGSRGTSPSRERRPLRRRDRVGSLGRMALSREEREKFLAEPHVGALSVAEGPGRAPLTVPIWYQYAPGGDLWIHTPPGSRKARAIEAAGRFSLMVQRTTPTVRYVSVEGPVTGTAPASHERSWEMAARYLEPEKVAGFVEFERSQLGEHIAIFLRPEHWISADLGPF